MSKKNIFIIILYIALLILVFTLDISFVTKIIFFIIINIVFYKITDYKVEKLTNILIFSSVVLLASYGSSYLIFRNSNRSIRIFGVVLLIICFITLIKNIFDIIKEIKCFTKKGIMLKREEERKKIINNFRELIEGLIFDEAIALLEIEIPKLQEGETKEIYKKGLSELYEIKRKEEERLKREKEEEEDRLRREKEAEEERIRIEKEKEEERTRISNEVKDNVENNRFIETNIPLIAEEGCFVMLDNIEVYEYRTRYGATNYEKVGEGKLYITNKKLYFIAEINAFPLVWLEHIIDIELEGTYKLKITRNGNAIFLESYDEMNIYKIYRYIKTIIKNK